MFLDLWRMNWGKEVTPHHMESPRKTATTGAQVDPHQKWLIWIKYARSEQNVMIIRTEIIMHLFASKGRKICMLFLDIQSEE